MAGSQSSFSWEALAFTVPLVLAGAAVIVRSLTGWGDSVQRDYRPDRRRTKTAVEDTYLIPLLTAIVDDASRRYLQQGADIASTIGSSLYRRQYAELWALSPDMGRLERLPDLIVRWMLAEAGCAGITLAGIVLLLLPQIVGSVTFTDPLRLFAFSLLILGVFFTAFFFIFEQASRRGFNDLVNKYEDAARGDA